jgi:hypothetical protein
MLQPFFKHLILDAHAVSSSSSLRASSYTSLSQIADTLLLRANREIKEQDKADLLDSVIKLTTFMVKSLSFLQVNMITNMSEFTIVRDKFEYRPTVYPSLLMQF